MAASCIPFFDEWRQVPEGTDFSRSRCCLLGEAVLRTEVRVEGMVSCMPRDASRGTAMVRLEGPRV